MGNVTLEDRKNFTHSAITNEFGLTVDQVVSHADDFGRFSAWLGGDHVKIKEVLTAVENKGISPAWFAAYEYNEGYNPIWGWLNHTYPQGDPVTDAKAVCDWINTISVSHAYSPSWYDASFPVHFVPQSVITAGNADFASMPNGTIGRVYIPGTAAATWATYYPQGLLASYNQVQNYADPIATAINTIRFWGGTINGSNEPGDGKTDNYHPQDGPNGDKPKPSPSPIQNAITILKRMFSGDLYSNNTNYYFFNDFIRIEKQLDNTYKIKPNFDLDNLSLEEFNENTGLPVPDHKPANPGAPDPPTSGKYQLPFAGGLKHYNLDGQQYGWTGYKRGPSYYHDGYDFGSDLYDGNILAVTDATVKFTGVMAYGLGMVIVLNNGVYDIMYQEFASNSYTTLVKAGETVKKGQKIATLVGSHLHLGITKMDFNAALAHAYSDDGTWLNPIPILQNK